MLANGGALLAAGFRQRQVCPGLAAAAAPVLLFDHVAGLGQVGDGAVGAAFGDAPGWPRSRAGAPPGHGRRTAAPGRDWSGRSSSPSSNMLRDSGNMLLVTGWERSVQDRHRNPAANDGSLPGATAGAHARRPGHRHRRGHGARSAAHPAEAAGARCKPPGQVPGPAAADVEPVTR